jgi:phosphatidylglycerol:prolipoprotein diacylglycerol transferase
MFPKLVDFGHVFIPSYGVFVALGFLAGIWLALRLSSRAGLDREYVTDLAIYCALTGLLGSKLLMFAFDWQLYAADPSRVFSLETLMSAGVYHGGFAAAAVFAWFYVRRRGQSFLRTADVLAPGLALGHAVGRLGCFAAGCCWGAECNRPWAVTFTNPDANALTGVPLRIPLHPTQLYESAATLLVAVVLAALFGSLKGSGRVFGLYLVLYGAARTLTESYRMHDQAPPLAGLTWTQWMAVALGFAGFWLLARRRPAA